MYLHVYAYVHEKRNLQLSMMITPNNSSAWNKNKLHNLLMKLQP